MTKTSTIETTALEDLALALDVAPGEVASAIVAKALDADDAAKVELHALLSLSDAATIERVRRTAVVLIAACGRYQR